MEEFTKKVNVWPPYLWRAMQSTIPMKHCPHGCGPWDQTRRRLCRLTQATGSPDGPCPGLQIHVNKAHSPVPVVRTGTTRLYFGTSGVGQGKGDGGDRQHKMAASGAATPAESLACIQIAKGKQISGSAFKSMQLPECHCAIPRRRTARNTIHGILSTYFVLSKFNSSALPLP